MMDASTAASPGGRIADATAYGLQARLRYGARGLADSSKVTTIVTGTHVMLAANFPASPKFLPLLLYL